MSARSCPECGLPLGDNPRQQRHKRCADRRSQRKHRLQEREQKTADRLLAIHEHWCWTAAKEAHADGDEAGKWLALAGAVFAAQAPGEFARLAASFGLRPPERAEVAA